MDKQLLFNELLFKAVRSSGAGGQHVNKVSTKVILQFHLLNSVGLTDEQKFILSKKLANKLTKDGVLILFCDETRSQHQNKEMVVKRFFNLLDEALKPTKIRRLTKPTKSSVRKRIDNKKRLSEKKALRKRPKL